MSYASHIQPEDLQWRAILMKEILGYQVDEVATAMRLSTGTIECYVSRV